MAEFDDFDDIDDELEDRKTVEQMIVSLKALEKQRTCVFMEGEGGIDIIHGRLMAFIKEWPAIMVRDLTPGQEKLQRKRLINLDSIRDMCMVDKKEKCLNCDTWKELQMPLEEGGEEEKSDDS